MTHLKRTLASLLAVGSIAGGLATAAGAQTPPPPSPTGPLSSQPECTIVGTRGDDVLRGTARLDIICGRGGDDVIRAGARDVVLAGRGNDTVILRGGAIALGGRGRDRFFARNGIVDGLIGQAGRDKARADRADLLKSVIRL